MRRSSFGALSAIVGLVAGLATSTRAAERVVFCAPHGNACAGAKVSLGSSARGRWALVDDVELRGSARDASTAPRVLYFSRAEYEDAIAGLPANDRERAVLRRLERMTAELPSRVLGLIHDDLVDVAVASSSVAGDSHADSALAAAVIVAGGATRFDGVRPIAAVQELRRSLARLLAELPDGVPAAGYAEEAALWSQLEAEVRGAPALAPPFASPERVYFMADMPAPRRDPLFVDTPTYGWRGGVVMALRPSEVGAPTWRTHRPRLVYYDRGAFVREVLDLTDAQLDQRLTARLDGPPARERAELIAALAFAHAVLARQYAVAPHAAGAAPRWRDAVALDAVNLRRLLAVQMPSSPRQLKATLARLSDDLVLAPTLLRGLSASAADTARLARVEALMGHD